MPDKNTKSLVENHNAELSVPMPTLEHRGGKRTLTVLKTVKVQLPGEEGLAKMQNISDDGMKLSLKLSVCLGDIVTVFLSDVDRLEGKVIWTNGESCGLQFTDTVDSSALLTDLAERSRDGSSRPVRMAADAAAVAYCAGSPHPVRVKNISQRGLKIEHRGSFSEGLPLKVMLGTGIELRGVVRWSHGNVAGIELLQPVGVEELGRAQNL